MQVMHHPWSQKLDRDVMFSHPETKQPMAVPCWTLCLQEHNKAITQMHERASAAPRQRVFGIDCLPHCWSMPHLRFEDVAEMLTKVRRMEAPYTPRNGSAASTETALAMDEGGARQAELAARGEQAPGQDVPAVTNVMDGSDSLKGLGMETSDQPAMPKRESDNGSELALSNNGNGSSRESE